MKEWNDLSKNTLEQMVFLGSFSPTFRPDEGLIKGYMADEDGTGKCYLDAADLKRLAEACLEVAEWLEKRKLNFKQVEK